MFRRFSRNPIREAGVLPIQGIPYPPSERHASEMHFSLGQFVQIQESSFQLLTLLFNEHHLETAQNIKIRNGIFYNRYIANLHARLSA